jgi:L-asparaginase / beta-aspartyl-peptidase
MENVGDPSRPNWAIVLHAGAGNFSRDQLQESGEPHRAALMMALKRGRRILQSEQGTSLTAVEIVVRALEDCPWFNAGRGSVFTHEGLHELDASIMDGRTLACGAVANTRVAQHPITLARRVMEQTPHVMLAGAGADAFAAGSRVRLVPNSYFSTPYRRRQWEDALSSTSDKFGTVGCVALDRHGNLAAGTSTGGLTNKRPGRVGDSPIIGAGTYANNRTCGISASGIGEQFIRHAVAAQISAMIEFGGRSLHQAAHLLLDKRLPQRAGGVIGIDPRGNILCHYTTSGMYRGWADSTGRLQTKIWD